MENQQSSQKPRDIKYEIVTKRDAGVIKAFLTFVNRVKNPRVTANFIIFGLVIFFLPFTTSGQPVLSACCYIIGAVMVLMGFFRHYIPLTIMKRKDPDYISGVKTSYVFTGNEVQIYRDGELQMLPGSYQKITSFFSDEYYYYVGMNDDDLFVLPKDRFTIGDSAEFQDFICKKSKMQCRWIPVTLKNKLLVRLKRDAS